MSFAKSRAEFEAAAEGLPTLDIPDLSAEVICVEPVDGKHFRGNTVQRCIVRLHGTLYVSPY